MKVSIYQDQTLIGVGQLDGLDPPMGVAFGPFTPSDRYQRGMHANLVNGEYVGDKGQSLVAHTDKYGILQNTTMAIENWSDPEIATQLTIWFQDGLNFAEIFSEHRDYKAYYPDDR